LAIFPAPILRRNDRRQLAVQMWQLNSSQIYWYHLDDFFTSVVLAKNQNSDQKSKFLIKGEIWVKNENFGQKLKFWSKIKILVKN